MQHNVMIIDDDADDRYFLKEAIESILDFAVCCEATDGVDALCQLRKVAQLPDFIFLDVNMPRLDGKECLKEIKKDPLLKNIPVIMYSTASSPNAITEFYESGAAGYLNKPTDMNKLPAQILDAIRITLDNSE